MAEDSPGTSLDDLSRKRSEGVWHMPRDAEFLCARYASNIMDRVCALRDAWRANSAAARGRKSMLSA
jgi:hypothetical protein